MTPSPMWFTGWYSKDATGSHDARWDFSSVVSECCRSVESMTESAVDAACLGSFPPRIDTGRYTLIEPTEDDR